MTFAGQDLGQPGDPQEPRHDEPPEATALEEREPTPGTILAIEDLVGAKVVTRAGESRGGVVDVRATPPPELRVLGLIVGNWSWLERLRVAARLRQKLPEAARLQEIPWESVERWDGLRVVLRDDGPARAVDAGTGQTGTTEPGKPLEPEKAEDREPK